MRKLVRVSLALLGLATAAGMTLAVQPPGGRPQGKGGFQGGRGGFGAAAGGVAALLRSKTVIEEVKIDEGQQEKLLAWARDFGPKSMEIIKEKMSGVDFQDREKMREIMASVQAELSQMVYEELGEVLKPEQVKRLKQIEVQFDGLRAFDKPEVKSALKLTDNQLAIVKDAVDATNRELRELGEEYGVRFPGARPMDAAKAAEYDKKAAGITKEAYDKIKSTLSDEQMKAWNELTGPEVDVAKIRSETAGGLLRGKRKDD